jgi:hypothetical protein
MGDLVARCTKKSSPNILEMTLVRKAGSMLSSQDLASEDMPRTFSEAFNIQKTNIPVLTNNAENPFKKKRIDDEVNPTNPFEMVKWMTNSESEGFEQVRIF